LGRKHVLARRGRRDPVWHALVLLCGDKTLGAPGPLGAERPAESGPGRFYQEGSGGCARSAQGSRLTQEAIHNI